MHHASIAPTDVDDAIMLLPGMYLQSDPCHLGQAGQPQQGIMPRTVTVARKSTLTGSSAHTGIMVNMHVQPELFVRSLHSLLPHVTSARKWPSSAFGQLLLCSLSRRACSCMASSFKPRMTSRWKLVFIVMQSRCALDLLSVGLRQVSCRSAAHSKGVHRQRT